jgi:hypothetical protein
MSISAKITGQIEDDDDDGKYDVEAKLEANEVCRSRLV